MVRILLMFFLILFLTLPAFTQSLDTAWVRRFNGQANDYDAANAIVVDDSGNVYTTGRSYGIGTNYDCVTIKYYPNGDTAWVRRYNGPSCDWEEAYAIAIDGYGNVFVTGVSWGNATYWDYLTIKYYPNGDTAWVRKYNGPGNLQDKALAITVDGYGNAYVTGASMGDTTGYDYATIKYHSNGDTAWLRRYNGPDYSEDDAFAIAVDDSNNVYVSGTTGTIKYNAEGEELWVRSWGGVALALDGSDNVCVTGGQDDYITIKYYPNGDTAWVRRYNGTGNPYYYDYATAIAIDGFNNIYVTGYSWGDHTSHDYATVKYYTNGDTAWVRRYNGPGNYWDVALAMVADDSGNVYVTGYSSQNWIWPNANYDYATIKYDSYGNEIGVRRYNGPGNLDDKSYSITTDNYGNVYVTGCSYGIIGLGDYATIKYINFFMRGDTNGDKQRDVSDIVYLINYLFRYGPASNPSGSGDANCDGKVSISDVVYLINYLLKGGSPPPC